MLCPTSVRQFRRRTIVSDTETKEYKGKKWPELFLCVHVCSLEYIKKTKAIDKKKREGKGITFLSMDEGKRQRDKYVSQQVFILLFRPWVYAQLT